MQTFLPYKSFRKSAGCLDYRRLGKQRVEAMQILRTLEQGPEVKFCSDPETGEKIILWGNNMETFPTMKTPWYNHPAVKMWRGYEKALHWYKDFMILEWIGRGYKTTMQLTTTKHIKEPVYPPWLTDKFCQSHRSNLLRKNPTYYKQFNWNIPDNLPYIWPI